MQNALSDIKVLDLTQYIAGPYCTKLLADYGAEVLKIEKPFTGDGARRVGPFYQDDPDPEKSGLFLHLNTNKQSITLDLKTVCGKKILLELVKEADILVENYAPRVMPSLGLDYAILAAVNPALVMTSISNFGQTGPYRDYKATELILSGMGLHMHFEGEPTREPLKFPANKAQYLAGNYAATATLGAYFGAHATGRGQQVDISIMECLISPPEAGAWLMAYEFTKLETNRVGHRREGSYPIGVYPCRDGYIFVYGVVSFFWPRIAAWMNMPELLTDPRFATPAARRENHGDFDALFIPWLMEHSREELFHSGQANRLPVAPVYTIDETLQDPQFVARGSFTEVEHPMTGKIVYPGLPFRLPETPCTPQNPAPLLGEHNHRVYVERLGYTLAELSKLREMGVI
ncbi:MAG: CoA transferase [Dehalococcoidales bacterium]|nr:CoA transferase [Dehalococcoidales bacterium]